MFVYLNQKKNNQFIPLPEEEGDFLIVLLKQMRRLIEQKSGSVRYMTSINWKNKHRESDIEKMVTTYHA